MSDSVFSVVRDTLDGLGVLIKMQSATLKAVGEICFEVMKEVPATRPRLQPVVRELMAMMDSSADEFRARIEEMAAEMKDE